MVQYAIDGTKGAAAGHFPPISVNSTFIAVGKINVLPGAFDWTFTPDAAPLDLSKHTFLLANFFVSLGYGPYNGVSITGTATIQFNGSDVLCLAGSHSLPGDNQFFVNAVVAEAWTALTLSGNLTAIRTHGSWNWNDVQAGGVSFNLYFLRSLS